MVFKQERNSDQATLPNNEGKKIKHQFKQFNCLPIVAQLFIKGFILTFIVTDSIFPLFFYLFVN